MVGLRGQQQVDVRRKECVCPKGGGRSEGESICYGKTSVIVCVREVGSGGGGGNEAPVRM